MVEEKRDIREQLSGVIFAQVVDATREMIEDFGETGAHSVRNKLADSNFGLELRYIMERLFDHPPYTTPWSKDNPNERDLFGLGWRGDIFSPNRMLIEYQVDRATERDFSRVNDFDGILRDGEYSRSALMRDYWAVHRERGVMALPLDPLVISTRGGKREVILPTRSLGCLISELHWYAEKPAIVIETTTVMDGGSLGRPETKLKFRILKPPTLVGESEK
ncbi:MAG: hypothetical protein NTY66_03335 [Candidatus Vogelbacteria bacterium]|nr:hypothetical protein [Candidatus Vogelbacteria bacterium]